MLFYETRELCGLVEYLHLCSKKVDLHCIEINGEKYLVPVVDVREKKRGKRREKKGKRSSCGFILLEWTVNHCINIYIYKVRKDNGVVFCQ